MLLRIQVLQQRIPFLIASIDDFKDHIPRETDFKVHLPNCNQMMCVNHWLSTTVPRAPRNSQASLVRPSVVFQ